MIWKNPVLAQELRRRVRAHRAWILLSSYLALTSVVTLLIYLAYATSRSSYSYNSGGEIGKAIFYTVIFTTLVQVCIITPSLAAGSIAGEKENQTFDLLITTPLSSRQIVVGKLFAALAYVVLLIFAVLPLAGLSFLFGGISAIEMGVSLVTVLVTAMLYATVGIFFSTIMRTTLAAVTRSQAVVIFFLLAVPFLLLIVGIANIDFFGETFSVYIFGTMLSSHPFIALGMTLGFLSSGENLFFQDIEGVVFPSPWIIYTGFSLVLTLLLLFISVRWLDPVLNTRAGQNR